VDAWSDAMFQDGCDHFGHCSIPGQFRHVLVDPKAKSVEVYRDDEHELLHAIFCFPTLAQMVLNGGELQTSQIQGIDEHGSMDGRDFAFAGACRPPK